MQMTLQPFKIPSLEDVGFEGVQKILPSKPQHLIEVLSFIVWDIIFVPIFLLISFYWNQYILFYKTRNHRTVNCKVVL